MTSRRGWTERDTRLGRKRQPGLDVVTSRLDPRAAVRAAHDLDEYVQNIEVPGIQGLFESIVYARDGAPVTIREAALIYAQGMGMPVLVGTPPDIADKLEEYMDDGGADGFMLIATYTPGCFEEFVDLVVPELQRRGRYRTAYPGTTLRENLREA